MRCLDFDHAFSATLMQLCTSDATVDDEFLPKFLELEHLQGAEEFFFWNGTLWYKQLVLEKAKGKSKRQRTSRGGPAAPAAALPAVDAAVDGGGATEDDRHAAAEYAKPIDDLQWLGAGDDGGDEAPLVAGDVELSEHEDSNASGAEGSNEGYESDRSSCADGVPTSSGEEFADDPDSDASGAEGAEQSPGGGAGAHKDGPGALPRKKRVVFFLHERSGWLYVPIADYGYIVYNQDETSLNAHCECEAHRTRGDPPVKCKCHCDKSLYPTGLKDAKPGKGRVLGLEALWLTYVRDSDGRLRDRDEHAALRKQLCAPEYWAERRLARDWLKGLPDTASLFRVEPKPGAGSDSEPDAVP